MQQGDYRKKRTEYQKDRPKLHFENPASDTMREAASAGVARHEAKLTVATTVKSSRRRRAM